MQVSSNLLIQLIEQLRKTKGVVFFLMLYQLGLILLTKKRIPSSNYIEQYENIFFLVTGKSRMFWVSSKS